MRLDCIFSKKNVQISAFFPTKKNTMQSKNLSIAQGIEFLLKKGAIIPSAEQVYLEKINIVGLEEQRIEYFINASKRLLSLLKSNLNSNQNIFKIIPKDVHIYTNGEFFGYDTEDVFFLKYKCQIQRYQKSGLCYLSAPTITQTYKIIGSTNDPTKNDVLDISNYIMTHFTSNQLYEYIFDASGCSSELFLESILVPGSKTIRSLDVKSIINNFKQFGPGLVSNFHVYGDFLETNVHHHHGLPNFDDFKVGLAKS